MRIHPTYDELVELTSAWTGDRFADGRPRVPDVVLERLRDATNEQVWEVLEPAGYSRQFTGGWRQTQPGVILVGRAVTAQFLPHRPDYDAVVVAAGAREEHPEGNRQNTWIVDSLQAGDVMVTDIFGKVRHGTVVGDNLGTAVAARTGAGAVIDGGVRDLRGLTRLKGANFLYRDADPTPIRNVTLAGINLPVRIGATTVLPGDVVLGTPTGLTVIPPQLARRAAEVSKEINVRDEFGKRRLAERAYTSAEIDVPTWPAHIEQDFRRWKGARR